ncbi:hypothetical protein BWD42_22110 [Sphingobacterium sp. CZ-UAM]|uniref:DUF2071 domain-containing protein n=1 Tax=Sphingobacterium sp. CZ-UAM TaxID=1933868 RepID=UPI000984223A|nr:DUF2071 domain-containing protein [Sphingobacterium sp. CZ-UAM]OOG16080.1 hypothetical protein BWD42_22110 [Sphingobacterium sp. CZ-UAM]
MSLLKKEFRSSKRNMLASCVEHVLNGSFLQKIKNIFPPPFSDVKLRSDISNVVYLNWMIPLDKIQHLIPEGIQVDVIQGKVLFSILTYRHGHFGPAAPKGLRPFYSSPLQSNWRFYIAADAKLCKEPTVLFVSNCMSSLPYCLGSRLFSNMMYTHHPLSFIHQCIDGGIHTKIDPGAGSAADLEVICHAIDEWKIPGDFLPISTHPRELLEKIIVQNRALTSQALNLSHIATISLDFDFKEIKPLKIDFFKSHSLYEIVDEEECFAFQIPSLTFFMVNEKKITKCFT